MGVGVKGFGGVSLLAGVLLFGTGASDTQLAPGLWEVRTTPGVATLNGRRLQDLPIGEIESERVCVGAAEAAAPARFFAREVAEMCRVTQARAQRGQVRISGSCASQSGGRAGAMRLTGRYGADSFQVDFATTSYAENGRMTFSGRSVGRRVGSCAGA